LVVVPSWVDGVINTYPLLGSRAYYSPLSILD